MGFSRFIPAFNCDDISPQLSSIALCPLSDDCHRAVGSRDSELRHRQGPGCGAATPHSLTPPAQTISPDPPATSEPLLQQVNNSCSDAMTGSIDQLAQKSSSDTRSPMNLCFILVVGDVYLLQTLSRPFRSSSSVTHSRAMHHAAAKWSTF